MQSRKDLRNYFSIRCTIFTALPTMCSHSTISRFLLLANDVQSVKAMSESSDR